MIASVGIGPLAHRLQTGFEYETVRASEGRLTLHNPRIASLAGTWPSFAIDERYQRHCHVQNVVR